MLKRKEHYGFIAEDETLKSVRSQKIFQDLKNRNSVHLYSIYHALHTSIHFTYESSYNTQSNSIRQKQYLCFCNTWRNRGIEKLSKLFKVIQLMSLLRGSNQHSDYVDWLLTLHCIIAVI